MIKDKGGIRNCRRVTLFLNFIKSTRVKHVRSNDPSIDYYVCGSDQIWNPNLGGTPFYFANFAPKEKRIAYAASFGMSVLPANIVTHYATYIKDMAHISVREHAGAALIQNLAQRDVPVVLDPTLLLNRQEWHAMAKKPKFPIKNRYVLMYFLGYHSDDVDKYIEEVAQKHNLQIVSLNNMHKDQHWFHTGPSEFLWLIENASLVCTNSYHATVFSIIMGVPFVNFKRDSGINNMNSRIETLLETMQLSERVYGRVKEECLFNAEYQKANQILEDEKIQSVRFLREALDLNLPMDCQN